jgi:hypothetical protein
MVEAINAIFGRYIYLNGFSRLNSFEGMNPAWVVIVD